MEPTKNGMRTPRLSDAIGSSTAPTTPATTNTAPMMPAWAEVMPWGSKMDSSTVSTVLKMPIDTKQTSNTSKYARFLNSFLMDAALKSSLIAAGPGGSRRGFSRVSTMHSTALTTAIMANTHSV